MVWGCSSGAGLGSLVPVKGTLNASAHQEMWCEATLAADIVSHYISEIIKCRAASVSLWLHPCPPCKPNACWVTNQSQP